MDVGSPVYAALGAIGFDALEDLSHWLDGPTESTGSETTAWHSFAEDRAAPASGWEV